MHLIPSTTVLRLHYRPVKVLLGRPVVTCVHVRFVLMPEGASPGFPSVLFSCCELLYNILYQSHAAQFLAFLVMISLDVRALIIIAFLDVSLNFCCEFL